MKARISSNQKINCSISHNNSIHSKTQSVGAISASTDCFPVIDAVTTQRGIQGEPGKDGEAATIELGTVETGEPGTDVIITNSGTSSAAVFNFTIPRGSQGVQGEQGPQGDTGADGFSPIATVTKSNSVTTITITDKNGTTTEDVYDGVTDVEVNGTSVVNQGVASVTVPTNNNQLINGAGYITGITSSDVTTALGYTPYNSSNPAGYITDTDLESLKDTRITKPQAGQIIQYTKDGVWENVNFNSTLITDTLGYTPYNANNPNGYTSNVGTVTSVNHTSPDGNGNVALTIPTVNNATLTITQGGVSKGTFTANASSDVTIDVDAGGDALTVENAGKDIAILTIPTGYTEIESVTMNNNCYYQITGFHLRGSDTVRISLSVSGGCNVFGCYQGTSATDNYDLYVSTSSGSKYLRYGGGTYLSYWSSSNLGRRFDIVFSPTGTSGMPQDSTWTPLTFESANDFLIGATTTTGISSKFVGTFYGHIIVDNRAEFIPLKRNNDNVVVYYEIYSGVVYEPIGTNPTAGAAVTTPTMKISFTNVTGYTTNTGTVTSVNNVQPVNGNVTINALPSQTGQAGKFLTTDGTNASWGDLNGKADIDLTNVNNSGTSFGAGWAMPSNTYDDLTVGATGTTYTAPANGYFLLRGQGADGTYIGLYDSSNYFGMRAEIAGGSAHNAYINLPVRKGQVITLTYSVATILNLRFFYAVGSESEAP